MSYSNRRRWILSCAWSPCVSMWNVDARFFVFSFARVPLLLAIPKVTPSFTFLTTRQFISVFGTSSAEHCISIPIEFHDEATASCTFHIQLWTIRMTSGKLCRPPVALCYEMFLFSRTHKKELFDFSQLILYVLRLGLAIPTRTPST